MSRKLRLHGCIELDVPDDIGDYSAWQDLESHLEALSSRGITVTDYFAGKIVDSNGAAQHTSHYPAWIKEVTGDD